MITVLYIVGFLLLFHGVYQLVKYLVVISEVKKKFHTISAQIAIRKAHRFFVLVPVLHEEKTIERFLGDQFVGRVFGAENVRVGAPQGVCDGYFSGFLQAVVGA